jgi:hypothetical protein
MKPLRWRMRGRRVGTTSRGVNLTIYDAKPAITSSPRTAARAASAHQ